MFEGRPAARHVREVHGLPEPGDAFPGRDVVGRLLERDLPGADGPDTGDEARPLVSPQHVEHRGTGPSHRHSPTRGLRCTASASIGFTTGWSSRSVQSIATHSGCTIPSRPYRSARPGPGGGAGQGDRLVCRARRSATQRLDVGPPSHFVDVYATMGLALLVRSACRQGYTPTIYAPASDDVRSYLARQDFFEVISPWYKIPQELQDLKQRRWHDNPRVAPLTLIESEDCISPVVNRVQQLLVSPEFGVSKPVADGVSKILSEALQNVPQHASVGLNWTEPGIAVLQMYPGALELAIGDTGVGLRASLRGTRVAAGKSDQQLQTMVLRDGLSRIPDIGRGNGLPFVAATIVRLGGLLRMQSGESVTFVTTIGYRYKSCSTFPGTQLWIRIPCRHDQYNVHAGRTRA